MKNSTVNSGGIGFFSALFLIFLTLKLTGVINWSWWLVTAPLWGGVAFIIGVVVIFLIIAIIAGVIDAYR